MPSTKIDPRALQAWRTSGIISSLVYLLIVCGIVYIVQRFHWPLAIVYIALILGIGLSCFEIAVVPTLRWNRWRYDVHEHEIDLQHGLFVQKRTLIPMARIQHVDTKQGPILRKYGLATVTFSTAAGSHEIPALSEHTADRLRQQIALLTRLSEDDV